MARSWLVLLLASCYSPSPQPGSPCDKEHPCPSTLVCSPIMQTCVRDDDDALDGGVDDATGDADVDAMVQVVTNDKPADAADVTDGGAFESNLTIATDEAPEVGCGDNGGSDVFFDVTLTEPEVYYFDTFGSDFDSTLRVFPGKACTLLGAAADGACSDDACNTTGSQLAAQLPAGTSCIVVDRNAGEAGGGLQLNVTPGGRNGLPLAPSVSGDTCTATDVWRVGNCADRGGKDIGYYFTICPNDSAAVDALTCSSDTSYTFDTVLYLRKADGDDGQTIECSDDDATCPARVTRLDHVDGSKITNQIITGPGLGWLVIDGYDGNACGAYTLDSVVQ